VSIDKLLIQYLTTYTMPRKGEPEAEGREVEYLWWNNALTYIQSNLATNEDFALWLRDKFNDQATADAFIDSFNEFIRKDLFTNEKEA
jgi:hypothetical protein